MSDATSEATASATQGEAASTATASAVGPGSSVGRHLVLHTLGRGGMGVVYAAYDPQLDRKIALKLMRPGAGGSRNSLRLLREAQAMARLSHPNVVVVHDVGTVGEDVWLAMELIEGKTLATWLATPRRWREVLRVMLAAGSGLAAAHAVGLLHRDFKPDNVMIGDDGRVCVMDFGLARAHAHSSSPEPEAALEPKTVLASNLTREGALVGTPAYMAPEQLGHGALTVAADQFAYCVTLWMALYGERPFGGASIGELVHNVLEGSLRPPTHGRGVPGWLRRACERGLAVDPAQRWPSMAALLDALTRGHARARTRRGLAVAGAVVLLGAGALVYRRHDVAARTAACEATGAEVEVAWSSARAQALRDAIVASGASGAQTTADATIPWLERQAAAWREARVDACLAAEVEERWDADTLDRALWCLDERRVELESLVDELTTADATVVHKATTAAAELASVAPCRDPRALRELAPLPSEEREAVRAVRAEVVRAGNLMLAGRYDRGLERARAAFAQAKMLGWAPLTAAAGVQLGALLDKTGAHANAEAALEDAYFEAAGGGAPEVAATAASTLVGVVGTSLARPADGRRWGRLATLALADAHDDGSLGRARLIEHLAAIDTATGAYDDAQAHAQEALAIHRATLGAEHPRVGQSLSQLAIIHIATGAHAEAEACQEQALAIDRAAFGPDHPRVAFDLNALGNIHQAAGRYDAAKALYEQALAIQERALGPDHPNVASTLNNLAIIQQTTGHHDQARALYERALAIQERAFGPRHPVVASTLGNLALCLKSVGATELAAARFERVVAIQQEVLGPAHPDLAMTLNNLALVRGSQGAHEEAKALYERAIAILEEAVGPEHPDLASPLNNLGEVFEGRGAPETAIMLYERALAIRERAFGPEHPSLAVSLLGLARVALGRHRPSEALALAQRALLVRERGGLGAERLAEARFVLARAAWDGASEGSPARTRAIEQAEQAREAFAAAGPGHADELAAVQAWLASRDAP